ncbi:MAG: ATP-binding cassette domain-containing protein, partial [Anaerolineae bacterium]|nr:ATP-binding cassette domain-containing protein [Anaerolineae bacterium]
MSEQTKPPVVLHVENVTKRFPGVLANDNVTLELHQGEILALLGENGAGKSTLMNIVYGLYRHDQGRIFIQGREVRFASPREAIHSGIGMVHQHFQLIPVMSVAENVVLGAESTLSGRETLSPDETRAAGWARLVWGVFWRLL